MTTVKGPHAEGKSAQEAVIYARVSSFPRSIVGRKMRRKRRRNSCYPFHFERCTVASPFRQVHDWRMTTARTRPSTPDIFSSASPREPQSPSENPPSSSVVIAKSINHLSSPRHVLPADWPNAIKQLDDREHGASISQRQLG